MKRVCDESRISNKHFINDLSFKLNIKQNKIRLPKNSLLSRRFKVPCSQSIGPKNSKISRDAIKYLSGKIGKTENLFMAQFWNSHTMKGEGKKAYVGNYIFLSRTYTLRFPLLSRLQKWEGTHRLEKVYSQPGFLPLFSHKHWELWWKISPHILII